MNPSQFPTELLDTIRGERCGGYGFCIAGNPEGPYPTRIKVCMNNCKPVQCPNMAVCGDTWYPPWFLDCHGGTCISCNERFGIWCGGRGGKFTFENTDFEACGICMETPLTFARLPACDHSVCVSCFKKLFQYDSPVTIDADVPFPIAGISLQEAEENISDNPLETMAYLRSFEHIPEHLLGKLTSLAVLWWHYVDELCEFNEFDNRGTGKGRRCPFCPPKSPHLRRRCCCSRFQA